MVKYEKYKTKTGKEFWSYYGYLGIDPKTGKKVKPRGRGFKSKAEAKLNYERKVEEYKKIKRPNSPKKISFSELFQEYLIYYKDSGIKPGTYKKFKDEVERYAIPEIGDIYIDQLSVDDCQKTFNNLKKKRKDFRKIRNQISTILDFAISKQYIDINPMRNILVGNTDLRYKKLYDCFTIYTVTERRCIVI